MMMELASDSNSPERGNAVRPRAIPTYEPFNWKRFFLHKKYIPWWIILIILIVIPILITIYHNQIVEWLHPASQKIRDLPFGWVIPIIILFIISFPPLFGHEIVAVLCGIVYGLWIGFGIVAAGTFLGEVGTYYAFKGVLRHRAEKEELRNLNYACLATVTREGGIWFVFVARLSAIPSHLTTAVFSTCGISVWVFLIATFLSLPKQAVIVYVGVIVNDPNSGKTASNVVLGITFILTIFAALYVYWQMRQARPRLLAEAEALRNAPAGYNGANDEMAIEMANRNSGGNHILSDKFDEEAVEIKSPIIFNNRDDDDNRSEIQKIGIGVTTEERYEVSKPVPAAQASPVYRLSPIRGIGEGNWGESLGYYDIYNGSASPNASSVDLARRPMAGRELV
ncbi:Tlg2-vesicle protein [Orbilia brochopaga]|uniref:Golgi apparatus membrane protein TVP38 n=1 Tax=Orbilia brochopaga TaxID=3140254 RepID=A0AAV9UPS7_9PEZI